MKEIHNPCPFNILHVCDYLAPYANYDAVYDYPGQIINCNSKLTDKSLTAGEVTQQFKRPFMGGMDRHGFIAKGSPAEGSRQGLVARYARAIVESKILARDSKALANQYARDCQLDPSIGLLYLALIGQKSVNLVLPQLMELHILGHMESINFLEGFT